MIGYWTTKEGQRHKIKEMETSHIKNCISLLKTKMPDHENDITECADFPESMFATSSCYTVAGAWKYREKIDEFKTELKNRKS